MSQHHPNLKSLFSENYKAQTNYIVWTNLFQRIKFTISLKRYLDADDKTNSCSLRVVQCKRNFLSRRSRLMGANHCKLHSWNNVG